MATTYTPSAAIQSIAGIITETFTRIPRAGQMARADISIRALCDIQERIKQTAEPTQAPQQLEILSYQERNLIITGLNIAITAYKHDIKNAMETLATSPYQTDRTSALRITEQFERQRVETLAIIERLES